MAAKTIATNVEASTETEVVTIKNREHVPEADLDVNIDVPFFDKVTSQTSFPNDLVVAREPRGVETANHPNVCISGWI